MIESGHLHFAVKSEFSAGSSNSKLIQNLGTNRTSSFPIMFRFFVHLAFQTANFLHRFYKAEAHKLEPGPFADILNIRPKKRWTAPNVNSQIRYLILNYIVQLGPIVFTQ
jgi:hypothetical protein